MRILFIVGFVLMVAAQWYAPVSMILDSQATLDEGTEYKFKTRPVDPTDPFRGKYVTLNFEAEQYYPDDTTTVSQLVSGQTVYLLLYPDTAGYAAILDVLAEAPEQDVEYLEAKLTYGLHQGYRMLDLSIDSNPVPEMSFEFPFRRFYMEESKASEAEKLYWSTRTDSTTVCYALVKVSRGKARLTDVMINDRSIVEIVREINEAEE